jgi:hypothetical protein
MAYGMPFRSSSVPGHYFLHLEDLLPTPRRPFAAPRDRQCPKALEPKPFDKYDIPIRMAHAVTCGERIALKVAR